MEEPAAYGKFGLANLLELREECLREFQFFDAYVSIKQRLGHTLFMVANKYLLLWLLNCFMFSAWRENEASLAVLPDLLMELDSMDEVWERRFALSPVEHVEKTWNVFVHPAGKK